MGNKIVKERFRFRTFPTEGSNHNRQKIYVKHYFIPLKKLFSGNEIARFTRNASADLSVIKYLERRSYYFTAELRLPLQNSFKTIHYHFNSVKRIIEIIFKASYSL